MDGLTPISAVDSARVTHYGERFSGRTQGCRGYDPYSSTDASIVAIGEGRADEWPCGTVLRICGPASCLVAQRSDTCGGCGPDHVDLSEEGLDLVCGPDAGVCQARVEAFQPACKSASALSPGAGRFSQLFAMLAETALQDRTARLLDLGGETPLSGTCAVRAAESQP